MLEDYLNKKDCNKLLKKYKSFSDLTTMAFYCDITSILAVTCKSLQQDCILLGSLFSNVEADVKEIQKRYIEHEDSLSQGYYLSEVVKVIKQNHKYQGSKIYRAFLDEFTIKRIRGIKELSKVFQKLTIKKTF